MPHQKEEKEGKRNNNHCTTGIIPYIYYYEVTMSLEIRDKGKVL